MDRRTCVNPDGVETVTVDPVDPTKSKSKFPAAMPDGSGTFADETFPADAKDAELTTRGNTGALINPNPKNIISPVV
jgi:hypothetical protein